MADDGTKYLISQSAKLKGLLPPRSHGDFKPCHIKRAAAGGVPAHYRVGLRITFNNPTAAQAFAKALNIP